MMRRGAVLILLAAVASGCFSRGPSLPSTVAVKGKILLPGGQPLRAGRLEFIPDVKPPGFDGFADVHKDGTFVVQTFKGDDGVVPGSYTVVVSPFDYHAPGGNPQPLAVVIPKRYQDAKTSDLKYTFEAGKDEDITIQLKP
jgi:hypothetical protein